jgi:hypothetical protein
MRTALKTVAPVERERNDVTGGNRHNHLCRRYRIVVVTNC